MKKCDVIIPIYNAYDYVKKCIESVIKNTDLESNTLILINDKSTDERILPLLKDFKNKNSKINIVVLDNEENLGFVKTVNKGMKYTKNDVLLLNSDTEVPKNWLEKIKRCAYSGENIATVTPLSNNATLVSVPKKFTKNDLPDGMSIDEFDEIIEKCSYCDYPELPTAHGFCMYIKREVLDLIGYFDEESFGRGYGEENDFSCRCLDFGYRNVLCDNTVVYHKESQSFSNEKELVTKKHTKILEERYSKYANRLREWCNRFPIQYILDNIVYYINVNKRKNILVLIHDWETQVGGTTLHVLDIVNGLKDKYNFHILAPSNNSYKLTSYFGEEKYEKYFPIPLTFNNLPFYNTEYKKILIEIVDSLNINLVHVQHMIGHYFDIKDVILEKKLESIITLHDLYSICPTVNMLYKDEDFCNLDKKFDCKECLAYRKISNDTVIDVWKETWNKFLSVFDKVIVPSNDTKNRIEKQFNIKATVIEHGVDFVKSEYEPNIENKNKFNIALIGVMCNHKGALVLRDLIKINNNYNIHLFGKSELPEFTKNKNNFIYHGKYKRDDLLQLLINEKIDLICFFSTTPETYAYTLNEAMASNIPILTYDLGAGADKIKENNLGWLLKVNSTATIVDKTIMQIFENKKEYNKKVQNLKKFKNKTVSEMNMEYKKLYSKKIVNKTIMLNDFVKKYININGNGYSEELDRILNSTKWKLINKIKFPEGFVKIVRKIMSRRSIIK